MGLVDLFDLGAGGKVRYRLIRKCFGSLMQECFNALIADEVRAVLRRLGLHPQGPIIGDTYITEVAICYATVFHVLRGGELAIVRMQRKLPAGAQDLDRAIVAGWQQHRWSDGKV